MEGEAAAPATADLTQALLELLEDHSPRVRRVVARSSRLTQTASLLVRADAAGGYTLELNAAHPLVASLAARIGLMGGDPATSDEVREHATLLADLGAMAAGSAEVNQQKLAARLAAVASAGTPFAPTWRPALKRRKASTNTAGARTGAAWRWPWQRADD